METDISLASQIEMVDPRLLKPHPDREKAGTTLHIDDGTYQFIKKDIQELGIQVPIKVQKGTNIIIGGHTRHRIAIELGLTEVPVIFLDVDEVGCRYEMVTDNYKRIGDEIDPMKKAWTFDVVVRTEGFRNGGDRRSGSESTMQTLKSVSNNENINGDNKYNLAEIANRFGMRRANFIRYLDLLNLIPEFQELVSRQSVGVKTGSIISHWLKEEQLEFYRSFPLEKLQKQEFHISETDAVNWYKLPSNHATESEVENKTVAELIGSDERLNKDGMLEINFDGDEESKNEGSENALEEGPNIVDIVNTLDRGGKRPKEPNEVELGAGVLQFIYDHPERLNMLRTFQQVEEKLGEEGEETAKKLEEATKEVSKRFLLIEDLDKRFGLAEQQLQSAMEKCESWLLKIVEGEILPLQSVIAGDMNLETYNRWSDLGLHFRKIADQFDAAHAHIKPRLPDTHK